MNLVSKIQIQEPFLGDRAMSRRMPCLNNSLNSEIEIQETDTITTANCNGEDKFRRITITSSKMEYYSSETKTKLSSTTLFFPP